VTESLDSVSRSAWCAKYNAPTIAGRGEVAPQECHNSHIKQHQQGLVGVTGL